MTIPSISQILGEEGIEELLGRKKAADEREKYCRARAEVEKAKLLDRSGNHAGSAHQFVLARTILEGLANDDKLESGQRRELTTLALLCAAWQAMEEGEATSSMEKYGEAARLFERAAEFTTSEKVALLAHGRSSYCTAVKLSTEVLFSSEGCDEAYRRTKESLEAAIRSLYASGNEPWRSLGEGDRACP